MELITYIISAPFFIALLLLYVFMCGAYGLLVLGAFGLQKNFNFFNNSDDSHGGIVRTGHWTKWQFWVCFLIGICSTYFAILIEYKFNSLFLFVYVMSPLLIIYLRMIFMYGILKLINLFEDKKR